MKFKFFSKYFPLPKFLKPTHIGISFSDFNVKAISLSGDYLKPALKSMIVPLERGVITNGKIVNKEEVVSKLEIIKEYFGSPFVFFTVPDELTYIFQTTVPVVKGGNASEAVAFTVEENVPLALADTVFDFKPMQIVKSENGYEVSTVVVVCVKTEVEKFIQAINESGLSLVGCIQESQAIASAVIPKDLSGTFGIVHARKDRIGIYLVKDGVTHFSTLRSILEGDYARQFLDEYDKFLEYSSKYNPNDNQVVKMVFVCGDFEFAKKVVAAIVESESVFKEAKLSNVWANILKIEDTTPSITYEDSLNFAGPLGAVLSDIL